MKKRNQHFKEYLYMLGLYTAMGLMCYFYLYQLGGQGMFKVLREVKDGFVVCLRTPDEQRAKEKTISLIDEGIKAFMQGEVKNAKTE